MKLGCDSRNPITHSVTHTLTKGNNTPTQGDTHEELP